MADHELPDGSTLERRQWLATEGTIDFVMSLYQLAREDVALLRVDITGLDVIEPGWDGVGTVAYDGTIPPERLEVLV